MTTRGYRQKEQGPRHSGLAETGTDFHSAERGTMTSKGQITIPKKIREHLSLKSGDTVVFAVDGKNRVVLRAKNKSIRDLKGFLYRPGQRPVSLEEMDQAIADAAAEKDDRSRHKSPSPPRRSR